MLEAIAFKELTMKRHLVYAGLAILALVLPQFAAAAEKLAPLDAAKRADELLAQDLRASVSSPGDESPAPLVDDATFIRRVSLDLVGQLPTPEQVSAFCLDPSADKRAALVRQQLANPDFGRNWARYWRDVIMYRASDPRALLSSQPLEEYLAGEFNKNTSWKDIAREFITASGDVRENGRTALIMAQQGMTEETTAEVSRIFMGIQIQCAQCHDHPTDRWKREQFHELAAFFPRISVRPVRMGEQRSFEVVSVNTERRFRGPMQRGGTTEHYMPDLDNPAAKGTLMEPKFFVTGRKLQNGTPDLERRTLLANWITSSSNPWFAKAFVNRIWGELVGEGFYEPLDDLGPDRACLAPQTLDFLAEQFVLHQHDIKSLFETIIATGAYQRASRPRRNPEQTPFAANCPQPLRGDQLYNSLLTALGISDQGGMFGRRPQGGPYGGFGPRTLFNRVFGYDPSAPRDEVVGSIPQALFMMNSPLVNQAINARGGTALARLLAETKDDEAVAVELYLRTLAREPSDNELATCLDHVREVGRQEGFEDVLWALVNSAEFLHRR